MTWLMSMSSTLLFSQMKTTDDISCILLHKVTANPGGAVKQLYTKRKLLTFTLKCNTIKHILSLSVSKTLSCPVSIVTEFICILIKNVCMMEIHKRDHLVHTWSLWPVGWQPNLWTAEAKSHAPCTGLFTTVSLRPHHSALSKLSHSLIKQDLLLDL